MANDVMSQYFEYQARLAREKALAQAKARQKAASEADRLANVRARNQENYARAKGGGQMSAGDAFQQRINDRRARSNRSYGGGNYEDFLAENPMMALIMQYMVDNQTAQNEAKQANETRYQDILQGYGDMIGSNQARYADLIAGSDSRYGGLANEYDTRRQRILDTLVGSGQQEAADIKQNWANQQSGAEQNLVSRGLANSTLRNDVGRAATKGMRNDIGRLQDRLRNQVAGYDAQLSGDALGVRGQGVQSALGYGAASIDDMTNLGQNRLGFMERRTDEYPETSNMASVLGAMYPSLMGAESGGTSYGNASGGLGGGRNLSSAASNPLLALFESLGGQAGAPGKSSAPAPNRAQPVVGAPAYGTRPVGASTTPVMTLVKPGANGGQRMWDNRTKKWMEYYTGPSRRVTR